MRVSLLAIKTTTRSSLGKLFVLELTKQQQMGSINLRRNSLIYILLTLNFPIF